MDHLETVQQCYAAMAQFGPLDWIMFLLATAVGLWTFLTKTSVFSLKDDAKRFVTERVLKKKP